MVPRINPYIYPRFQHAILAISICYCMLLMQTEALHTFCLPVLLSFMSHIIQQEYCFVSASFLFHLTESLVFYCQLITCYQPENTLQDSIKLLPLGSRVLHSLRVKSLPYGDLYVSIEQPTSLIASIRSHTIHASYFKNLYTRGEHPPASRDILSWASEQHFHR